MALTKVTGQVIKNTTDVTVGVLTVTNTLAVGGTVSIGGTLTYEDVTNVDAVGLITARNGIVVGSGITLSKDGDVFFTGIATGNGSGLTGLNASNISSGTVPTARLGSGTASSSTFLRGDSTFAAVTSTTINNNANNRVITGSGTADTLEGESTFTYDGSGNIGVTNSSGAASLTFTTPNNTDGGIYFTDGADGNKGAVSYLHTDDSMRFRVNGTNKLIIDSTGRLLLGAGAIATPKSSGAGGLDLDNGSISLVIGGNENSTGRTDGTSKINRIAAPHRTNSEEPVAMISCQASTSTNSLFYGGGSSYTNAVTDHKFYTAADSTTTSGTQRLTITSAGNLGLGYGTPSQRLVVHAGSDNSDVAVFTGGDVARGLKITTSAASGPTNDGVVTLNAQTSSVGEIAFATHGTERARIDSSGHMGLGVTPNANWPTNNDFKALQLGTGACVFGRGSGDEDRGGIAVNYYHTGSAEKYLANGNASGMLLNDGDVDFFVAGANSSGANAAMSKTLAMRIAADADIGIGTLDPDGRLHIMGGNLGGAGSVTASTSANLLVLESNTSQGLSFLNANDERANICFGTTGTDGNIEARIQYAHENVSTSTDRRNMIFRSGGGERMRIAGNGFTKMTNNGSYHDITDNTHEMYSSVTNEFVCRMRCTGNGYILYLDNNGATSAREFIEAYSRSDTETKFRVNGSGSVYSRSNVFTSFSDVKLKENIVDANSQWDDIKAVKVRNYNFKKDPSQKMIGVVAQELETVSAGLIEDNIDRDPDTNEELGTTTKGVKYSILYMKAIKCLQEAQTRIETLEAEVAALKSS